MEEWKQIPEFEDYEVSSLGRVKSRKRGQLRFLALCPHKNGYLQVGLYCPIKKKQVTKKVHRLVYSAFVRPITSQECIDHINRIKDDNRVENLRLATNSQNAINAPAYKKKLDGNLPKGVYKHKGGYRAALRKDGQLHYLGTYKTIDEAALAYNQKAEELFAEFAYLNEIESSLEYNDIERLPHRKHAQLPKGVSYSSSKEERYFARIKHNKEDIYLGSYATPEEAALAYNDAAYKIYGDEAELNDIDFQTLWDALRAKFDRERNKLPKGIGRLGNKYRARIHRSGKEHHIGTYPTIEEAVEARNRKLLELKGEL